MRYQVELRLARKDYLAAALIRLRNPAILAVYLIMSFVLSWLLCSILTDGPVFPPIMLTVTLGLFLVLSLAFIALSCYTQKINSDALLKSLGYRSSEISEEGYVETYASSSSVFKWNEFSKIKEQGQYFLAYTKGKTLILPKRLLPEGCAELLRVVAKTLNGKRDDATEQAMDEPPTGENVVVTRLTPADHVAFRLYHAYLFRKNLIVNTALILFFALLLWLMELAIGDYNIYPVLFLAIAVFLNLLPVAATLLSIRKEKGQNRVVYRFQDAGFEMENRHGKLFVQWDKLYTVRQTSGHVFLYLSGAHAVIMPKRDLSISTFAAIENAILRFSLKAKKNRA